ncbi:hypothetical protein HELRODRAFT_180670 [Helobdella robusta]|uniref:GDNF/GAS1 domain-containing protein n=1 Tax=Helobdella robusta TaxID=6412 RepID=T1FG53_HELRO|nr:hypothetical protein HELRODRAFT_180670 [Helobdella robusta]ESN93583.1 hypothetical protein HELRODRAFT_180670 [Helobdella robusta]
MVRTYVSRPTCAHGTPPLPSCGHVMKKCLKDDKCRSHLLAFEDHCISNKSNSKEIRTAMSSTKSSTRCAGIMQEDKECLHNLMSLHGHSVFSTGCLCASNNNNDGDDDEDDDEKDEGEKEDDDEEDEEDDEMFKTRCTDALSVRADEITGRDDDDDDEYFKVHNNTPCYEVCRCHDNQTMECHEVPCSSQLVCLAGSTMNVDERGSCTCYQSEIICPKAPFNMEPKAGLFLHVGFSTMEREKLENILSKKLMHSNQRLSRKMNKLLQQFNPNTEMRCGCDVYQRYKGNVLFEVTLQTSSHPALNILPADVCIGAIKSLTEHINSQSLQNPDLEISLIKVAQAELVMFHGTPLADHFFDHEANSTRAKISKFSNKLYKNHFENDFSFSYSNAKALSQVEFEPLGDKDFSGLNDCKQMSKSFLAIQLVFLALISFSYT